MVRRNNGERHMKLRLHNVYSPEGRPFPWAVDFLYKMLSERDPLTAISHERMPEVMEHVGFVNRKPYKAWYIIEDHSDGRELIGNIYLTEINEIGIFIKAHMRGKGVGTWAVNELMKIHGPARYHANIHPNNEASIKFFLSLGFPAKPCQITLRLDTREPKE